MGGYWQGEGYHPRSQEKSPLEKMPPLTFILLLEKFKINKIGYRIQFSSPHVPLEASSGRNR